MTDYSLTTFGESGELTQVRHALTAVGNGETVIGIRAKNGIVIAAEKKLASPLIDESSIHKIDKLCDYMGVSYAGIGPDFNAVVMKARKDVAKYHATYQDRITPFVLCNVASCNVAQCWLRTTLLRTPCSYNVEELSTLYEITSYNVDVVRGTTVLVNKCKPNNNW